MPRAKSGEGVLALDIGTSSVRAVVYDARGVMLEKTLTDLPYKVRTTGAGEVSSDPDALVPKFPSVEEIAIVVAGGTAGRFSAVVPGWMGGEIGAHPVTRPIVP